MRLTLLGLGLVGGSVARAVHGAGWEVIAWTPSGTTPRKALAAGAIDGAAASVRDAVAGADLVVLAAPPGASLDLLDRLGGEDRGALAADAVVSDVTSTKVLVGERAAARGLRFVGGHPMAGREVRGFDAADPALFQDRPWVLVAPTVDDAEAVSRVEGLVHACGARPVLMTAADHDAAVAAISHVPLVVAAALVEAMAGAREGPEPAGWPAAASLASTGWAGATRLARGDAAMGAGIARTNAGPLASRLRDVRDRLDAWIDLLERPAADGLPDEEALRQRLLWARARLEDRG